MLSPHRCQRFSVSHTLSSLTSCDLFMLIQMNWFVLSVMMWYFYNASRRWIPIPEHLSGSGIHHSDRPWSAGVILDYIKTNPVPQVPSRSTTETQPYYACTLRVIKSVIYDLFTLCWRQKSCDCLVLMLLKCCVDPFMYAIRLFNCCCYFSWLRQTCDKMWMCKMSLLCHCGRTCSFVLGVQF